MYRKKTKVSTNKQDRERTLVRYKIEGTPDITFDMPLKAWEYEKAKEKIIDILLHHSVNNAEDLLKDLEHKLRSMIDEDRQYDEND